MAEQTSEKAIIVKIQQSLNSSDDKKRILVYDKVRILFFESEEPAVVLPLLDKLGKEPKKYFKAKIEGNQLKIFEEMKNQEW